MRNIKRNAITLATALVFGVMPTAIAQSNDLDQGIPYEITFDGTVYPANLDMVEYPYLAASQSQDGDCLLNVLVDDAENVAGMTIASCSSGSFNEAAARFISAQDFEGKMSTDMSSHMLSVKWNIGVEETEPLGTLWCPFFCACEITPCVQ